MKDHQENPLEDHLRNAPTPKPPVDLETRLIAEARTQINNRPARQESGSRVTSPWYSLSWLPRIAFLVALASGSLYLIGQSGRYPSREAVDQALREATDERERLAVEREHQVNLRGRLDYLRQLKTRQSELERLEQERAQLIVMVDEITELSQENQSLQEQLNRYAMGSNLLTEDPLGDAREKAREIQCINNLKQLGLAYRIALNDKLSPDGLIDLLPYVGSSPQIVCCPSDETRQPDQYANSADITPADIGYLWELQDPEDTTHNTVLTRCPIHQTVGLWDGSVQHGRALRELGSTLVPDGENLIFQPKSQ